MQCVILSHSAPFTCKCLLSRSDGARGVFCFSWPSQSAPSVCSQCVLSFSRLSGSFQFLRGFLGFCRLSQSVLDEGSQFLRTFSVFLSSPEVHATCVRSLSVSSRSLKAPSVCSQSQGVLSKVFFRRAHRTEYPVPSSTCMHFFCDL